MTSNDSPPSSRVPGPASSGYGTIRYWLRFGDHDVELQRGETVIGRSAECQIVLDDPLVSRRHARLLLHGDTVTVEDLGSSNGMSVNGDALTGSVVVRSGARIGVGDTTFELYAAQPKAARPTQGGRRAAALTVSGPRPDSVSPSKGVSSPPSRPAPSAHDFGSLETLLRMADKSLSLGRGADAARLLQDPFRKALAAVQGGAAISEAQAAHMALTAVKVAEVSRDASWVDASVALYAHLERPMPGDVVERLYASLRHLPPISLAPFRAYLAQLRAVESALSPAERFVVRRLAGLEPYAASR